MKCPHCQSSKTRESQKTTSLGYRIISCCDCARMFNERTGSAFNNVRCPTDVLILVVLWRLRYKLSLRDLLEMFPVRGYRFTRDGASVGSTLRAATE
jgi:putative transposase